ncbi:MAG: PIN domain-containing protein [Methylococcaceae bacterium]|nr:PIN domain-containing protein [Methylococcaceae bacterium]
MIILDTHVWLWWVNQDKEHLKPSWQEKIEQADKIGVSAISLFEVAWLEEHERIKLPCSQNDWFEKALEGSGISLIPLTPQIASLAVALTEHHSDPQDRIIIATTLICKAEILTADKKFPLYKELEGKIIK